MIIITTQTKINQLKRLVLDGKKSRLKLVGKQVKYIGIDINKQLETNQIYVISKIVSGNYDSFIWVEGLPIERYSEYSRKIVPNCFNIEMFELV